MPIVSRNLLFYRPQADGSARVREVHTDSLGVEHTLQYVTNETEAQVIIDMNARDLTAQLVQRDIGDLIQWVETSEGEITGNPVSTFDFTNRDITENDGEDEVTQEFARRQGDSAMRLCWWIESLGNPQWTAITTRLGWSNTAGEIGERVQTRGINLTTALPDYDRVENV